MKWENLQRYLQDAFHYRWLTDHVRAQIVNWIRSNYTSIIVVWITRQLWSLCRSNSRLFHFSILKFLLITKRLPAGTYTISLLLSLSSLEGQVLPGTVMKNHFSHPKTFSLIGRAGKGMASIDICLPFDAYKMGLWLPAFLLKNTCVLPAQTVSLFRCHLKASSWLLFHATSPVFYLVVKHSTTLLE